jgi:hypothetical protein
MTTWIAANGAYTFESPHHGAFSKIQILTIERLLSGKDRPQFPDLSRGEQTFKKVKKEIASEKENQKTVVLTCLATDATRLVAGGSRLTQRKSTRFALCNRATCVVKRAHVPARVALHTCGDPGRRRRVARAL